MKLLYFARVRQALGKSEETLDVPEAIASVGDLIDWLKARDATYAHAFADLRLIRAAVDQSHAPFDAPIGTAREIAFFPPVTGG